MGGRGECLVVCNVNMKTVCIIMRYLKFWLEQIFLEEFALKELQTPQKSMCKGDLNQQNFISKEGVLKILTV